jgi:hypothetical protein
MDRDVCGMFPNGIGPQLLPNIGSNEEKGHMQTKKTSFVRRYSCNGLSRRRVMRTVTDSQGALVRIDGGIYDVEVDPIDRFRNGVAERGVCQLTATSGGMDRRNGTPPYLVEVVFFRVGGFRNASTDLRNFERQHGLVPAEKCEP